MFLKNRIFLTFFVKMSAKTFFLFKVRGAGAGAGAAFKNYCWSRSRSRIISGRLRFPAYQSLIAIHSRLSRVGQRRHKQTLEFGHF